MDTKIHTNDFTAEIKALESLLRARIKDDAVRNRARTARGALPFIMFADIKFKTDDEQFLIDAAYSPVRASLNAAIGRIGELIYGRENDTQDLHTVFSRLQEQWEGPGLGKALSIIDARWDGIGDWVH